MYVAEVALTDFRAIQRSDARFVFPGDALEGRSELPNVNVLVGANGGGKSTVLKAIAAAAQVGWIVEGDADGSMSPLDRLRAATGGSASQWPRLGGTADCSARLTIRLPDPAAPVAPPAVLGITIPRAHPHTVANVDEVAKEGPPALFAYGPRRRVGDDQHQSEDAGRWGQTASLLVDEPVPAADPWLRGALGRGKDLVEVLGLLMPPETTTEGALDEDGVLTVSSRGVVVPRTALSDGAQTYLVWVLDLLRRLDGLSAGGEVADVAATVLVDEVDQRMHPRWQQELLVRLSSALPAVQFIFSAHSPLVAAACRPENLVVLQQVRDAPDGVMETTQFSEDLFGKTADGVLTSSYFGLSSTRGQDVQAELRALAADAAGSDEAALEFMRMLRHADDGLMPRAELRRRPDALRRRRP